VAHITVSQAGQSSINLQLQSLKQQSLLLDRDLLILEDKIKKPFSIYLSQITDAKFSLETMTVTLDGKVLLKHEYTDRQNEALKKGGAQLLFKGDIAEGPHKLIAYYRSNKNYQSGAELQFIKKPASQSVEISLLKGKSKESRLQPKVFISNKGKGSSSEPVLYRYFNYLKVADPHTDILSLVMKAQKQNELGSAKTRTRLLKGQLYLDKGLHIEAGGIFKKIISNNKVSAKLRNEALFFLGKSYYHLGNEEKSLELFAKVREPISKDVRAEMQHLYSLILMHQKKFKQAAQYMRKNWWKAPGNWDIYARLNLGVALIHNGDIDAGSGLIKNIGSRELRDAEARTLVDKANQSLGYLLLNQNKEEQARKYLEKVSLNGPYSNLALLGAGWASARLKQYNQAVIPWMELQKNDIRDVPVQESMLTVPYAFEQMGLIKKSVRYYQNAVTAYESEQSELLSSIHSLKQNELVAELDNLNVASDQAWLKSVEKASQSKSFRYVKQLIDDDSFFNLVLNFREAQLLKNNADNKISKISDIQTHLLQRAGIGEEKKSVRNRDQIKFIQILAAKLLKRSHQLKLKTQKNIDLIVEKIKNRALYLLSLRKDRLDIYLVQARLALAQNYDRLNP